MFDDSEKFPLRVKTVNTFGFLKLMILICKGQVDVHLGSFLTKQLQTKFWCLFEMLETIFKKLFVLMIGIDKLIKIMFEIS